MMMKIERRFAAPLAVLIALVALVVAPGSAQQPTFSISDVSSAEGNAGRKTFTFTVTLTGANPAVEHRVTYRTADGTAAASTVARTSTTPISIPILGTATPYPVTLDVAGLSGTIDDVAVRLEDLCAHPKRTVRSLFAFFGAEGRMKAAIREVEPPPTLGGGASARSTRSLACSRSGGARSSGSGTCGRSRVALTRARTVPRARARRERDRRPRPAARRRSPATRR